MQPVLVVISNWYEDLNKAPWTPPGWFFGAAWTAIMICFSIFMAYAYNSVSNKSFLIGLFVVQLILNIGWNPIFFKYHQVLLGLVVISFLTLLIGYFIYNYKSQLASTLLLLPYFVWLLIATSLNAYIYLKN